MALCTSTDPDKKKQHAHTQKRRSFNVQINHTLQAYNTDQDRCFYD